MEKNRYANGAIYKVVDEGYNKCYIGSTCESLCQRMARHRDSYKSYQKNLPKARNTIYNMFDEYGMDNCKIELIEYYPCSNREELRRREGIIIKETDCVNKRVEGRKGPEYREDNKEHVQAYHKKYNIDKKDEISINKHRYYEDNKEYINEVLTCECGAFISRHWLINHKKSTLHRRYLMFQEGQLNNHIKCSCGSIVPKHKINRHNQTAKHLKYQLYS